MTPDDPYTVPSHFRPGEVDAIEDFLGIKRPPPPEPTEFERARQERISAVSLRMHKLSKVVFHLPDDEREVLDTDTLIRWFDEGDEALGILDRNQHRFSWDCAYQLCSVIKEQYLAPRNIIIMPPPEDRDGGQVVTLKPRDRS